MARAAFVACDFGAALSAGFDLVVTNPPYIASGDIAALPAEVRDFDPPRALDGGPDGLAAYRAIAADARRLLAPNAHLIAELGKGQSEAVTALLAAQGFGSFRIGVDLAGLSRTITASPNP